MTWFRFTLLLPVCLALVWGIAACSSSTDPDDGETNEVIYSPDRQFLEVTIPESYDFQVSNPGPATLTASWLLNGAPAGTGLDYQFQSQLVGEDILTVETVLNGQERTRDWLITVLPSPSMLPPPVMNITLQHGTVPMDVLVSWQWISYSTFPITGYAVAASYEGPVTVDNWDTANQLGTFPHVPGQLIYSNTFTAEEHGMLPGQTVWFAVRGVDNRGQMSPIPEIHRHTISTAWWLQGTVYDSDQNPLQEIIIEFCPGEGCRTNSEANGLYQLPEPFLDTETVTLTTYSAPTWYDFQSDPVAMDGEITTYDLQLITRYETGVDVEFLTFLREMTHTDDPSELRPNQRLYRWEEYPIPVFIPEYVRPGDGLDFAENSRLTLDYWNQVMGEDYLVEVQDPELASIVFIFQELQGANGLTRLDEPGELGYSLGDVIPEKMEIYINNVILPNAQRVQETAMHELGHAMGLFDHVSYETDDHYLLFITSAGALDNGPLEAVHEDERRMLHTIRYLPQGVDMAGYRLD